MICIFSKSYWLMASITNNENFIITTGVIIDDILTEVIIDDICH